MPNNVAAVDEDGSTRLTYPELDARVDRLAGALIRAGLGAGDRILWLGQNSFRILELILAAAKFGAIVCPANWRQSPDELDFIIADADPKLVVWQDSEIGERVRGTAAFGTSRLWLRHDADAVGSSQYETFLAAAEPAGALDFVDPALPLIMLYTAAFAGKPNGALISHNAIIGQSLVYAPARGITADYRYLNVGPMFHVATLMETLATFLMGGTNIFVPRNDPEEICRIIDREGITGAFVIGPAMEQLAQANKDGRYNLKSLRAMKGSDAWNGMVTVDDSPWGLKPFGYGQTETLGYATYSLLQGQGAMGRSSPIVLARIVDEAGNEVPDGDVGEIAVRGPQVSPGYWTGPNSISSGKGRAGTAPPISAGARSTARSPSSAPKAS